MKKPTPGPLKAKLQEKTLQGVSKKSKGKELPKAKHYREMAEREAKKKKDNLKGK
jgi:hypothetical protein